eukprot:scaffold272_cov160-Amphora_coffeaeformis.AAC.2
MEERVVVVDDDEVERPYRSRWYRTGKRIIICCYDTFILFDEPWPNSVQAKEKITKTDGVVKFEHLQGNSYILTCPGGQKLGHTGTMETGAVYQLAKITCQKIFGDAMVEEEGEESADDGRQGVMADPPRLRIFHEKQH